MNAVKKLPDYAVDYYVGGLTSRDALRGSFNFYRALDSTTAQNAARRKAGLLTLPVLAIGGEESIKDGAGGHDEPGRTRRADRGHPELRPLGRRGGA
ncbi:hypothetical protein [Streptomyces sp. NPDC004546]|uniref:hypothetical protein n=1 Tax=Streptomyces sp. NPDC004546 TaxID=3154282 RepID=UPI0033B30AE7